MIFHRFCLLLLARAALGDLIGFDEASASNTYSGGFPASAAKNSGSGYWSSSGVHSASETVTWTGVLNARRKVTGVKLSWAYSPQEFKVLVSADGANFEEAKGWTSVTREVSHDVNVMFASPLNVKALAVVMRGPRSWRYFGLHSVSLIAAPNEPIMLVSGISSSSEMCLVADGNTLAMQPCLEAIAAGDGRQVFTPTQGGALTHADKCVALLNGDVSGVGKLILQACPASPEASDGRTQFSVNAKSQLALFNLGDFCVTVDDAMAPVVKGCADAAENTDARDVFFMVGVNEFDPNVAKPAIDESALLTASVQRLKGLLKKLSDALPKLEACNTAGLLTRTGLTLRGSTEQHRAKLDALLKSSSYANKSSDIDMAEVSALVAETTAMLARIHAKVPGF